MGDGVSKLLPLKKLIIHGNAIESDGYAALGVAIRHERCRLTEFVVSAQIKEKKTGQNRVSKSEEHNLIAVNEIATLGELRVDFIAGAHQKQGSNQREPQYTRASDPNRLESCKCLPNTCLQVLMPR